MKILAVEFSSAQRSVAIWDDGGPQNDPPALLSSVVEAPVERSQRSSFPAQRSLGLVEEALRKGGCKREQVEIIVVGVGPGSYTGIRGGIALAQGWQLGRGVNLLGVSTADCLAAQAWQSGQRGQINIIIDAQRNEFYLGRYDLASGEWRELEPLRLAATAEIQSLVASGQVLLGPDVSRAFPGAIDMYPEARSAGRLACGRRDFVPGEKLEPIYLRETAFKKAPRPRVMRENEKGVSTSPNFGSMRQTESGPIS